MKEGIVQEHGSYRITDGYLKQNIFFTENMEKVVEEKEIQLFCDEYIKWCKIIYPDQKYYNLNVSKVEDVEKHIYKNSFCFYGRFKNPVNNETYERFVVERTWDGKGIKQMKRELLDYFSVNFADHEKIKTKLLRIGLENCPAQFIFDSYKSIFY